MRAPRIVASIEARFASTRLPGKVLSDINGQPALTRLTNRLRRCKRLDKIVLATTTNPLDDRLEDWAKKEGIPCYRGSESDVLQRVVEAQIDMSSEIVVEICGDTPLIDPEVVDRAIEVFLNNDCDIVSTVWKQSYPQGIDVEVFRLSDLEEIAAKVCDSAVREHVSLYFYEHPERYRVMNLDAPTELRAPNQRLQLDYPEDQDLIRKVYRRLEPIHGDGFGIGYILELLRREPQLVQINAHRREKPVRCNAAYGL